MKQLFTSSWGKGFAAGVLVCAAATLVPFDVQQAFAQQQAQVRWPPGTFMLAAPGDQKGGIYLIDTRTGDTWYKGVSGPDWFATGNPTTPKPDKPQK